VSQLSKNPPRVPHGSVRVRTPRRGSVLGIVLRVSASFQIFANRNGKNNCPRVTVRALCPGGMSGGRMSYTLAATM